MVDIFADTLEADNERDRLLGIAAERYPHLDGTDLSDQMQADWRREHMSKPVDYRFETNCINSDGDSITAMTETGSMITRHTFLRYVNRDSLAAVEKSLSYAPSGSRNGELTMARDWHVAYYRGIYQGRRCVYFVHSAIEYIFTKRGR